MTAFRQKQWSSISGTQRISVPRRLLYKLGIALFVSLLALGACKAPDIPRSDPPWITLGASNAVVTSLDTSRIGVEPAARVVWLRQTREDTPGEIRHTQSRHRVNCGTQVVTDLEGEGATPGTTRPFKEHPYGPRVFATVCNALGNLPGPETTS